MEHLGELGNGTCGHVVKMLHKSSQKVIAVKVSSIHFYGSISNLALFNIKPRP